MQRIFLIRPLFVLCSLICLWAAGACRAQEGRALAEAWCSGCHMFPEPQLLDRKTWIDDVLPEMGARLGFQVFRGGERRPSTDTPRGIYPDEPLLEVADWERIISWYEREAPERLLLPAAVERGRLGLFGIEVPERGGGGLPVATAMFIDAVDKRLLLGDSGALNLQVYGPDLGLLQEVRAVGVVSKIARLPSGRYLATVIGETIGQTEEFRGLLVDVGLSGGVDRLVRRLHRPVDMEFGDFNGDDLRDYVVAGFGTHSGKLTMHLGQADGSLGEVVLLAEAGATSLAIVGDDLWVLMAQGDERVVRVADFAGGEPVAEVVLRFPPSQGSSSMSVLDFNGDGVMDLLYTAGDNADISPVFKPYHGVYLYAGLVGGGFEEAMFFHLDGATSAVAEDFDLDGDLDIAAIAYYANTARGLDAAGFVYLQNNGGVFEAMYVEGIGGLGRYVAISAGDIDGDGDVDIALANLSYGPPGPVEISAELRGLWASGPHFVLLRNLLH